MQIDFREIYRLLDTVNPIDGDCGALCGAACCKLDPDGELGMYLLPGEETAHDRSDPWLDWSEEPAGDYELPASWTGSVYFVCCHGPAQCRREIRPIQCRTFPLAPHLTEDGRFCVIIDNAELPYACPLTEHYERLNEEFILTTWRAWKLLLQDERIYDMVYADSRFREECDPEYIIAYTETP